MKPCVFLIIATITTTSLSAEIPTAANAELKLVADGFKFTEGPAADRHGNVYFTDPFYKRPYWKNRDSPDQKKERVYFLAKGAKIPVIVEEELKKPNGIIGSPDGKLLYIADIGDGKTWRYEINEDGSLAKRTLFCELGSDGMTIDSSGNVYLTGKEVTVFDKDGKNLGKIEVPRSWTANITFAGADHNLLFITALDAVFTLEMTVTGSGKPKP